MTWRKVTNAIAVLVAFTLLALINASVRDPQPYRWYVGAAHAAVDSPMLTATVRDVVITREVTSSMVSSTTDEAFVVVFWSITAKREPVLISFSDVSLAAPDGVRTRHRRDFDFAASPAPGPGFVLHGASVFEVPESRLDGAALEILPTDAGFLETYRGAVRFTGLVGPDTRRADSVEVPVAELAVGQ